MKVSMVSIAMFWGFKSKYSHNKNAAQAKKFLKDFSKRENVPFKDLISVVVENADLILNPDGTIKDDGLI